MLNALISEATGWEV